MISITRSRKHTTNMFTGYMPFSIELSCLLPTCKAERAQVADIISNVTGITRAIADIVSRYNLPIHEAGLNNLTLSASPVKSINNIESNRPQNVRNNIFLLLSKIACTTGYPQPSKSICYPTKIIELARSISEYESWEENAERWMVADILYQILALGWGGITIDYKKIERASSYKK